jgi:hypothetical protein
MLKMRKGSRRTLMRLETMEILSGVVMSCVPLKDAKATVDMRAGTKVRAASEETEKERRE